MREARRSLQANQPTRILSLSDLGEPKMTAGLWKMCLNHREALAFQSALVGPGAEMGQTAELSNSRGRQRPKLMVSKRKQNRTFATAGGLRLSSLTLHVRAS